MTAIATVVTGGIVAPDQVPHGPHGKYRLVLHTGGVDPDVAVSAVRTMLTLTLSTGPVDAMVHTADDHFYVRRHEGVITAVTDSSLTFEDGTTIALRNVRHLHLCA